MSMIHPMNVDEGNWRLWINRDPRSVTVLLSHRCPSNVTGVYFHFAYCTLSPLCHRCRDRVPPGIEAQYHVARMVKK